MAEYRQIHTRIWKDNWFSELDQDAKLLFIYLFSNEQAEVGGVYELPIKYMAFEVGLSQNRVQELLSIFEASQKVYYRNKWVWVVNLRKYNETKSESVIKRIQKDLDAMPDGELKIMYCKYYGIPYGHPVCTVSIPVLKQDEGVDTRFKTASETETEMNQNGDRIDTTPTSPTDWRPSDWTPQMEAQSIMQQVTGLAASPPDELIKYTPAILAIKDKHNGEHIEYLKGFYTDWCSRKTKDGKPYKRTMMGWIDWALEGSAPQAPTPQTRRRKPVERD